jgi:hypothetical protein
MQYQNLELRKHQGAVNQSIVWQYFIGKKKKFSNL